jgi:hypothetical protein
MEVKYPQNESDQPSPGPTVLDAPELLSEYACVDNYGTRYEPFTDGWAVGFKVTPPDGVVQWLYLNPSSEDPGGEPCTSNVFLYHDEDEGHGPHFTGALVHVVVYEVPGEEDPEKS